MKRILLQLLAVGFCFAVGQALQCYKCKIGFFDLCFTTKTTCDAGQHCFSGEGKAVGFMDIKTKGCLNIADCNKTTDMTFPESSNSTVYSITKTCCNADLCNGAPGLGPARGPGLSLALATLTTLLIAHTMA